MSKITTFLKGLIRRLKEHMDAVNLTIGGIFIPLGFYVMVEKPEWKIIGAVAVIVGILAWLLAYWLVRTREKKERLEKIAERVQEQTQRQIERKELNGLLTNILQELHKLNQNQK